MVYISPGNRRMDIPTFSLPSKITCPNSTKTCRRYCYAKKAEMWKHPLESRMRNLEDTKKKEFVKITNNKIKSIKNKYIRIHESGDFYSQTYLNKWIKIAKDNPDKRFLIYTQMYNLNWSKAPSNMIIYWTVWYDSKDVPKDGLKAYVIDDGKGKIKNPIIPKGTKICTKGKGSNLKCNDCMWCYKGKGDVVFKLH